MGHRHARRPRRTRAGLRANERVDFDIGFHPRSRSSSPRELPQDVAIQDVIHRIAEAIVRTCEPD